MNIEDFRARQEADFQRRRQQNSAVRRRPFHERYGHLGRAESGEGENHYYDNDDAITSESEAEADEEIQSPQAQAAVHHDHNPKNQYGDEGEEA